MLFWLLHPTLASKSRMRIPRTADVRIALFITLHNPALITHESVPCAYPLPSVGTLQPSLNAGCINGCLAVYLSPIMLPAGTACSIVDENSPFRKQSQNGSLGLDHLCNGDLSTIDQQHIFPSSQPTGHENS